MPAEVGRRATLAMVAESCGVSLPTVSKVLNGRADVANDTRARVEEALRQHNYIPPGARSRGTAAPTRTVELVFDDIISPYATEVLHGVTDGGDELGVDVVVRRLPTLTDRPPRTEAAWARRMTDAGRKGLIVVTSELTSRQLAAFDRAGLSLVVIDPVNLPRTDVVSVGATNWSGGLEATDHLIRLGHQRIAFIGGPVASSPSRARLHGYRAALENAGIRADPALIRNGSFDFPSGLALGGELLDADNPPTAVFAASDPTAMGVFAAAQARDLRIPSQLSIVGFDDTYLTVMSTPALTTVRQPLRDMGRVALRTLLRLISGEPLDSHHVELATTLVLRESTAPPADKR
ncbi:LacI family transcriptional regulator [Asanoa ferruginea]|uniref:LacI family transcriptional regulator n=1 Tax=Asanoa ferruginea TaxID=53367 RepID=A0A3D9ZKQ7_9ACTN|nr:LacI family DNA-binding transcriptional regulator [Asanoa ferruginea]REF97174.1 LacI family transcriptional regulator [Asanoa ferruginea]GIF50124.1 LacI family transcriptional regulator [Asanoa ferruginea]